jgi:hypothetical protein
MGTAAGSAGQPPGTSGTPNPTVADALSRDLGMLRASWVLGAWSSGAHVRSVDHAKDST